jgi:hypothetical protein
MVPLQPNEAALRCSTMDGDGSQEMVEFCNSPPLNGKTLWRFLSYGRMAEF